MIMIIQRTERLTTKLLTRLRTTYHDNNVGIKADDNAVNTTDRMTDDPADYRTDNKAYNIADNKSAKTSVSTADNST